MNRLQGLRERTPEEIGEFREITVAFGGMADVLTPSESEEPILAPGPRAALFQWLTEIRAVDALAAVGLKPNNRALLYGPPGTGKTTMAHHLSARLGMPLVCVRSEGLISAYLGATGQAIGRLMDAAQKYSDHIVLFIDEIDALGGRRMNDQGASVERASSLNVLLRRIELLDAPVLAATNRHDTLDPALWRRFNLQISVDLPGEEERFAIMRRYAQPFEPSDETLDLLVGVTMGCSPALLRGLMEGFKRAAVLYPRLKRDVADAGAILEQIVSSVAPPPELGMKPALWDIQAHERRRIAEHLEWPWGRAAA
jgi:SpoVK/Ycf46/Vps4 family AAA+-type ATPase